MKNNVNIIKIGSDSLNETSLEKIINDAQKWKEKTGEKFIFISSGAVKLGRERVEGVGKKSSEFSKSALSSIGQNFLMQLYDEKTGINTVVAQVLIDDFGDERHLSQTLLNLLENDIWGIVNHNDCLYSNELHNISDKTDNDKNTLYISRILEEFARETLVIKRVIYLTNTHGLLDEDGNTVTGGRVSEEKEKIYYRSFVKIGESSSSGTGGMLSKLNCAIEALDHGVEKSIISNADDGLEFLIKDDLSKSSQFCL